MAKNGFKIIDAEMHIMEPVDLWDNYIDPVYKDNAPRRLNEREWDVRTIIDGEAALNHSDVVSNEVSGYRFISLIGKNFGNWELLGGYQYSSFEYIISPGPSTGYVNTRANNELDSHSTVGLLVFGVEIGF